MKPNLKIRPAARVLSAFVVYLGFSLLIYRGKNPYGALETIQGKSGAWFLAMQAGLILVSVVFSRILINAIWGQREKSVSEEREIADAVVEGALEMVDEQ